MKKINVSYIVIIVVSILAGILITTRDSLDKVSACVRAPGCVEQDKQPLGKLTTHNYGFPTVYKQTITFEPIDNDEKASNYAGFASATAETKSVNAKNILINILFWAALLHSVYSLLLKLKRRA